MPPLHVPEGNRRPRRRLLLPAHVEGPRPGGPAVILSRPSASLRAGYDGEGSQRGLRPQPKRRIVVLQILLPARRGEGGRAQRGRMRGRVIRAAPHPPPCATPPPPRRGREVSFLIFSPRHAVR